MTEPVQRSGIMQGHLVFLRNRSGRARLLPSPIGIVLEYQPEQRQEREGEAPPVPGNRTSNSVTIPFGLGGSLALPERGTYDIDDLVVEHVADSLGRHRLDNAVLRNDRTNQFGRRYVKCRVVHGHARRRCLPAETVCDFLGRALFNWNLGTRRNR